MFTFAHTFVCTALMMSFIAPEFCGDTSRAHQSQYSITHENWSWQSCGLPKSPVSITDVQLSSDDPKPGEYLTITTIGHTNTTIYDDATAEVLLKMGEFEYLNTTYPLCNGPHFNITCPLSSGDQEVVNSVIIPTTMPVAPYYVRIRVSSPEYEDLGCLELKVSLSDP